MRGGSSAGSDSPLSPTLCDFKEGNFRSGSHGHFLRAEFASVCSRGLQQGRDSGSCRGSMHTVLPSCLSDAPPSPLSPVFSLLHPPALCFDPSGQALCITLFCPCLLFFIALYTYLHCIIFNLNPPVEESFHEAGDFVVVITYF